MHKRFLKLYYFIEEFKKSIIDNQSTNTAIIYRNYKKNYKITEIISIRNYCRKKNIKFYLSNNIKLSISLNLDGAYLPSFNESLVHLNYNFKKNFVLIGSAHNLREIRIKERQKVKEIFLSSIFKDNGNFLGLNKFNLLSKYSKKGVIALGGISNKNIRYINLTNAVGVAGISYFKKKAPLRGPFYKYLKY
ncbi:MAG: thiamine phosphate synthase [Flavobacteriales bacterium TMED235]|nr:MAG: thiamine phosphate synthase [Flavobacteriales bacterium TMED235]|tara:strand:+ start:33 stop:605 length:573 start_codon:yes stop_codon:yes gene_type:complete